FYVTFYFLLSAPPPTSSLFPYTTLFRSTRPPCSGGFVWVRGSKSSARRAVSERKKEESRGRGEGAGARGGSEPVRHAGACDVRADRKSTRLNSSHVAISYAVFCLKKKKK